MLRSMGARCLLVSLAGTPKTLSDFVPDNGLASLAGALTEAGHQVRILDFNTPALISELVPEDVSSRLLPFAQKVFVDGKKPSARDLFFLHRASASIERHTRAFMARFCRTLSEEVKRQAAQFVGFKLWAGEGFRWVMEAGRFLKKRHPELLIAGGGPQVDIFGELVMERGEFFDAVCFSEGEETVVGLADAAEGKRGLAGVPNIIWRKDGHLVRNPRVPVADLDRLPVPVYSPDVYVGIERKLLMRVVDESRGCPNACAFCIHPVKSGRRRQRSASRICDDIAGQRERSRVSLFRFAGSNPPARLLADIAREIVRRGLRVRFSGFSSVVDAHLQDFSLLRRAGCEALFFGIESANEEILRKGMNKRITRDQMEYAVAASRAAGIFTVVSIIYPAPFETVDSGRETLEFLRASRPDSVLAQFAGVYPGTPWFEEPERYNFTLDRRRYPSQVIDYQIRSLFPPQFWKPLPYRINGVPFARFARQTAQFQEQVRKMGIATAVSDDAYLLYLASRSSSLERFVADNRVWFYAGRRQALEEEISVINEESRRMALAS